PMAQTEHRERLFYLIAGLVVIAGVAIGFRMFYMHGLNDAGQSVTQQIAPLVYLHGVLMTSGWFSSSCNAASWRKAIAVRICDWEGLRLRSTVSSSPSASSPPCCRSITLTRTRFHPSDPIGFSRFRSLKSRISRSLWAPDFCFAVLLRCIAR